MRRGDGRSRQSLQMPALCVKAMNLGGAGTVRHVDFAVCGYGHLGRVIERSAPARSVAFAKRRKQHAVAREAENLVGVAICDPDTIEVIDGDAVRVEYL